MFAGGIGQIDDRHTAKAEPERGMRILQVGGPAYRVGFGGGAASSMLQGENVAELDFNAVQRGDAEMEQKMNRVIRACNEMGAGSLIEVIHDQGAGGPGNVLKELVEKTGGRIDIRRIRVGDPTMSVLEIWVAEYQERNGLLVRAENLPRFEAICEREKVGCENLGEVTGDRRFVVEDSRDGSTPEDLDLAEVLGNIPQKTFEDRRVDPGLAPLALPAGLTVRAALERVLRLLAVGSKRFLTNKVDRSVTGLIARQQCCGPLQATVADVAVIAQSHFGKSGAATAIGEQPVKLLVSPAAGARMAVGEALTNLVFAKIDGIESVKCSGNWMWAPKLPGEGAAMCDAALAMRDAMVALGIAIDGGKDSLSMATKVGAGDGEVPPAAGDLGLRDDGGHHEGRDAGSEGARRERAAARRSRAGQEAARRLGAGAGLRAARGRVARHGRSGARAAGVRGGAGADRPRPGARRPRRQRRRAGHDAAGDGVLGQLRH